jgi:hypothetical protein
MMKTLLQRENELLKRKLKLKGKGKKRRPLRLNGRELRQKKPDLLKKKKLV